ncbi:uncharacterized protein ACRADG_008451 isoform 2-T3 [Cochliomyia hominivorax]
MDLTVPSDHYCRFCLKDNAFFNLAEPIFEFYGPSYKEFLYNYLQQQKEDEDVFSRWLCLDCGNDLKNIYKLMEKAHASIESITNGEKCRICLKNDGFFDWTEEIFEFYGPTYKDCYLKYTQLQENENVTHLFCLDCGNVLRNTHQLLEKALQSEKHMKNGSFEIMHVESEDINDEQKPKRKSMKSRRPIMCSYCSKISYTKDHHVKHEKLHTRRERTELCPKCGLKFYTAEDVKKHLVVHDENRAKDYKCDLCPKAFYTSSGLRYHRISHMGGMVKCHICSKSFNRRIDLEYHIRRSHEGISKERPKEFKDCKFCGQTLKRESLKTHLAKHLNQPLGKCNICEKTYFKRESIIRHLKLTHKINKDYNKYIELFQRKFVPRRSSLMKKQNIDII